MIDEANAIMAPARPAPGFTLQTPRFFFSTLLILMLALALGGAAAGDLALAPTLPDGIQTPAYTPGQIPFHPGQRLFYSVTWEQFPVAFAKISLRTDPKNARDWVGEASVTTNRLLDVFYRLRANLREEFGAQTPASDDALIRHNQNDRVTD